MNENYNEELISNRAKNTLRNGIFTMINVFVVTFIPFILRTVFVYTIGDEYLGLNSLYVSIMNALNMAELGIGTIMIYFLYDPIARNDIVKTNAYLAYLKKIYRVIGIAVFAIGICVMPSLGYMISGDVPNDASIYSLYLVYLLATAIQYFVMPEVDALVGALQRTDITNLNSAISNFVCYIFQFIALIILKSYMFYILALLVQILVIYILRKSRWKSEFVIYKSVGDIDADSKKHIKKKVFSMIGHQLDSKVIGSIDNIFLSAYLGLTQVAIYGNYSLIISAISMILFNVITAILPSIGNAIVTETKESNYFRYKCIFQLNSGLIGWGVACFICMCQNFMFLWMGDRLFGYSMVVLLTVYFYAIGMRQCTVTFKNAAGMWDSDFFKPYVAMIIDLVLDVFLIKTIGVSGAVISSIVAIGLIELPWEAHALYKNYFEYSFKEYLKIFFRYFIENVLIIGISVIVCDKLVPVTGVISLVLRFLIPCIVTFMLFILFNFRSREFKVWVDTVKELYNKIKI